MKALLLLGALTIACHPDPACAPGQAFKREADCVRVAAHECSTEQGEFYTKCIDEHDKACDAQAELYAARCSQ